MKNEIRVMLVDDHDILREGLKGLLEADSEVRVVATAGSAAEGLTKALGSHIHVAVIDLSLPDQDGLWLLRQIRAEKADLPVLVLSMHADEENVVKLLAEGASGYLTKGADSVELLTAIRSVHQGGSYLQPRIAPFLLSALRRGAAPDAFSQRERQILRYMADGLPNQTIADLLFVSTSTVKAQLRALFRKLDASTRTEAVVEAMRRGLLENQREPI